MIIIFVIILLCSYMLINTNIWCIYGGIYTYKPMYKTLLYIVIN